MKPSVLKPGLLVSLRTSLRGGVNYKRIDIDPEHKDESGAIVATWQTTKEITDPREHADARFAQSQARAKVTSICCASAFGLLCPESRAAELDAAMRDARAIAERHNERAALTRVDVYVLVGRIAQDDVEAARAIGAEIRDLLADMQAGIERADAGAIREAANKARAVGAMLAPEVSASVQGAIDQAREAARAIVKRVEKAGERAADVVAQLRIDAIQSARFAFLDLDETAAPYAVALATPAIDLTPAGESAAAPAMYALPFDLE